MKALNRAFFIIHLIKFYLIIMFMNVQAELNNENINNNYYNLY